MLQTTIGGAVLRQTPPTGAASEPGSATIPPQTPGPRAVLTEADFRAALGGISERKFKELRAAGLVGAPLELGQRTARWLWSDVEATVQRLPRRAKQAEPVTLAQGRRARIERIKADAQ